MKITDQKLDEKQMEALFVKITGLIATEIAEIKDVKHVDKEMGCVCMLVTNDNKQVILSLI